MGGLCDYGNISRGGDREYDRHRCVLPASLGFLGPVHWHLQRICQHVCRILHLRVQYSHRLRPGHPARSHAVEYPASSIDQGLYCDHLRIRCIVRLSRSLLFFFFFVIKCLVTNCSLNSSASCATIVRLRYLLALLDSQNFLQHSGKIAIWTVLELTIGLAAGSAPALRPLLRHIPFMSYHDTQEYTSQGYRAKSKGTGQSQDKVKMDTFGSGSLGQLGRNKGDRNVIEDGDSQEYILQGQDGQGKMGIRKDISVQVNTSSGGDNGNPTY